MRALIQQSNRLRRLATTHSSAVPRPLLQWIGSAATAAFGGDDAPARGSAVWLGWDAWVSPIDGDRSRTPSPNPELSLRRRTS